MNMILKVRRVIYGHKDTPLRLREYRQSKRGPVGFVSDWQKVAKESGFNKVIFTELDGSCFEREII